MCDTGAVAAFNDGARRTVTTRTPIRLRMSDRHKRRLNERGNKAERELPKNRPATFSETSKKIKPNRGMGRDRTRRGGG